MPPELSDSSSTWPPEGHSVTQQLRSNCSILLYTSAGLSMDANNSLSLWQPPPPPANTHKIVVLPRCQILELMSSLPTPRSTDGNNACKCCVSVNKALSTRKNRLKKLIISLSTDNSLETKEMGVIYALATNSCVYNCMYFQVSRPAENQLTQSS